MRVYKLTFLLLVVLCGCQCAQRRVIVYEELNKEELASFERAMALWSAEIGRAPVALPRIRKCPLPIDPVVSELGRTYGKGEIFINSAFRYHSGEPHGKVGMDVDLDGLALHEIGHYFGLGHSPNPEDVMFWRLHSESHFLHEGDKAAIKALYSKQTIAGVPASKEK